MSGRRMYAKLKICDSKGRRLKQHHHVKLDKEFRRDSEVWITFLPNSHASVLCCPFVDLNKFQTSTEPDFFMDASGKLGYGSYFRGCWACGLWNEAFLKKNRPSIEYLELYALCVGIMT